MKNTATFSLILLSAMACQRGPIVSTPASATHRQTQELLRTADDHYRQAHYHEAIRFYDLALKSNPALAVAWFNRGNARFKVKDLAGAIGDFDQTLRLDADFPDAHYNRATARFDAADYAGAISDYNATLRRKPKQIDARYNRGAAYFKLERFKLALADFDCVIDARPDFGTAYNYRAKVKLALGDRVGASADYALSLRAMPGSYSAYVRPQN